MNDQNESTVSDVVETPADQPAVLVQSAIAPVQVTQPVASETPLTSGELVKGKVLADGGVVLKPAITDTIQQKMNEKGERYEVILSQMERGRELARLSSHRVQSEVFVYIDAQNPVDLDKPEIKNAAYAHRLHYGMGEAGIEMVGGPYRLHPGSTTEPVSLYDPTKIIWRRKFKLNSSV